MMDIRGRSDSIAINVFWFLVAEVECGVDAGSAVLCVLYVFVSHCLKHHSCARQLRFYTGN